MVQINNMFLAFSPQSTVHSSTTINNVRYLCAGDLFGYDLSPQSCADANRRMGRSPVVRTWGPEVEDNMMSPSQKGGLAANTPEGAADGRAD